MPSRFASRCGSAATSPSRSSSAWTSSRCWSSSSRSSPCNLAVLGLREDPVPGAHPQAADAGRAGARGDRGVRRADGLDRGRRAADAPARSHVLAAELIKRKKFVFLCTNAILMKKKLDKFKPSPLLLVGRPHRRPARAARRIRRARTACSTRRSTAIKEAKARGFRVTTNTTFFNDRHAADRARRARLPERRARGRRDADLARVRLREGARPGALPRRRRRRASCSPRRSPTGNRKKWRLNHTPLFLDFLEGKVDFQCTAWGIPSYSLFGWQRPCYLMGDGYAETYKELIETTDWDAVRPRQGRPRARTAWPTAATSRRRCCTRWARCASRSAPSWRGSVGHLALADRQHA